MFILLPHVRLKATILYTCALISSSRSFYHILGLWHHIMWHVMWLQCHIPLHHPKEKIKEKIKENQYKIRKRKEKKNKIVSVPVSYNIFSIYYVLLWIPSTVLSTLLLLLFFIYSFDFLLLFSINFYYYKISYSLIMILET